MAAMMNPPEPGKPSYQKFNSQKSAILQSLARRAAKLAKGLRALEGVTCVQPNFSLFLRRVPVALHCSLSCEDASAL